MAPACLPRVGPILRLPLRPTPFARPTDTLLWRKPTNARLKEILASPENGNFKLVFFPDRIYHAQYLNAMRSPRYRYSVQEGRSKHDVTVLKAEVCLDSNFYSNLLRVEYRSRLLEKVREQSRFLRGELLACAKLLPEGGPAAPDATVKMCHCHCPWLDAYQVEMWEALEAPEGSRHDFQVLDLLGKNSSKGLRPSLMQRLLGSTTTKKVAH